MLPLPAVLFAALAAAPGDTSVFLAGEYVSDEGRRHYKLFVPAGRPDTGAPLVVLLHGCGQDPEALARGTRFNELAIEVKTLVLYPEQPAAANPIRCWNWFEPAHQSRNAGETALLAGMTRQVAQAYRVDPRRIYIAGISAGGAMAVLTALAYPELFAAAGSHSGVGWRVAHDLASGLAAMRGTLPDTDSLAREAVRAMGPRARAMPLIALHGTADTVVRPGALRHLVDQFVTLHERLELGPLRADTTRGTTGGRTYLKRVYRDARGHVLIEDWLIDGLGHAWSGGSPEGSWTDSTGPDGTRAILHFFLTARETVSGKQ